MRNTTITKAVVAGMLAVAMTTTVFTGAQTSVYAEEQQQMTNDEIALLEAKKAAMEADMAVYPNCKGLTDAHDRVAADIK